MLARSYLRAMPAFVGRSRPRGTAGAGALIWKSCPGQGPPARTRPGGWWPVQGVKRSRASPWPRLVPRSEVRQGGGASRSDMSEQRVVLITGASSGVGQSTARLLSQRGYRVFGTSRDPAKAEPLFGVELLPLDVRADDSVQACVEAVFHRGGHLEVLINNAGHELAGALEELSPEEARGQFETNFFGVVRMINAVLPFMRQRKAGHIVNVSSLSGLPIPFLGIYSASKFALEGYTEAFRHEVKPFGIRVSLTEAGFLRTPMMNNRQVGARRIIEYDPWRQRALDSIRASEGSRRGACSAGTPRDRIQREAEATLPDRAPGEVGRAIASVPSRGDVRAGSAPCVLARQECVTCCEDAMPETKLFEIVSWISLPTVMFGGYSLLSLLRSCASRPSAPPSSRRQPSSWSMASSPRSESPSVGQRVASQPPTRRTTHGSRACGGPSRTESRPTCAGTSASSARRPRSLPGEPPA
jgi:NAD(P)-dependent dehydrogenase (short-subunit alcohol dehydrogenase family)